MELSPIILKHLARIGATFPEASTGDAVTVLVQKVNWPVDTFTGSIQQFRDHLTNQGRVGVASWSDDKLRDEMPLICGFKFLQSGSRGKFWDGWENSFTSVDPTKLFPLAYDDYYYYFLAVNEDDATDPSVYSVDHEESEAEPYDGRFQTISHLLSIIEAKVLTDTVE